MLQWSLFATAVVGLAGIVLLRLGLSGWRVGDAPHCRRCGFDLAGLSTSGLSEVICPECGADVLAGGRVRLGARRKSVGLALLGLALALAGGAGLVVIGYGAFTAVGGRPGWALVWQARHGAAGGAELEELTKRGAAGTLSAGQTAGLIETALVVLGDPATEYRDQWRAFMEQAVMSNAARTAQAGGFAKVSIPGMDITIPREMVQGGELVIDIAQRTEEFTPPQTAWYGMEHAAEVQVQIDERTPLAWQLIDSRGAGMGWNWRGGGTPRTMLTLEPNLLPGEYRVTVRVRSRVYPWGGRGPGAAWLAEETREVSGVVRIKAP